MRKFLGRHYDVNTDTWVFSDGSGRVPNEMRIEMLGALNGPFGGLVALAIRWEWEDRLKLARKGYGK